MKNKVDKTDKIKSDSDSVDVDMTSLNDKIQKLVESFETQVSELKMQLDGRLESQDELVTEAAAEVESQKEELKAFIESVKNMDKKNTDYNELEDKVKTMKEDHDKAVKSLKARLDSAEAKGQAPSGAAGTPESDINAFFKSDKFKEWEAEGFAPRSAPGKMKMEPVAGYKATGAIALGSTELSAAAPPVYRAGVVERGLQETGLFSVINRGPQITGEVYHAPRETAASAYGFLATTTVSGITGSDNGTTVKVNDPLGFVAGAYARVHCDASVVRGLISSVDTTNSWIIFTSAALTADAAAGSKVTSEVYGAQVEEGYKPAGMVEVEDVSATLKTLATYMTVSKQRLAAAPGMASWMEGKLRDRFERTLDWHLLYGDDTSDELSGFFNDSELTTVAWSDGETDDNYADAVLRASQSIASSGQLTCVMHRQDWLKLLLAKDDNANYVHSSFGPLALGGESSRSIGDIRVVLSDSIVPDTALLADLSKASEFVSNGSASLEWGYISDNFVKNMITPLYEEMVAHIILDPFAFVKVSFDSAPG